MSHNLDAADILQAIVEELQKVKSAREEMSAEDAFNDAIFAVAFAISEAVKKIKKPSAE